MLRKLTTTLILLLTSSLVLASSAFAVLPADSLSGSGGSGTGSGTGTSGDFPWFDAMVGVVLAVVGIACLAAVSRNRRHSAALQS
jgi:hypothetical protein